MIKYRVAVSADDYAACRKLMKKVGMSNNDLGFPTILAIDDEGLLGFMATTPRTDMVLAGPLVTRQDGRSHGTVALRLVSMYELALKNIGISSFIFYAEEDNSILLKLMDKYFPDVKPYAKHGSVLLYSWHIDKMREDRIGA